MQMVARLRTIFCEGFICATMVAQGMVAQSQICATMVAQIPKLANFGCANFDENDEKNHRVTIGCAKMVVRNHEKWLRIV